MKTKLHLLVILFIIAIGYKTTAQITLIPDPKFEQFLIYKGIDSDGVINGQVLTSDVENVTELIFSDNYITDLTGIEDFSMLEHLYLDHNLDLTSIDISNNFNLKILNVSQNSLTELDLSNNILLEELYCGNPSDDTWPQNQITKIDLSNNPNIRVVYAENMYTIKSINIKNQNNNADIKIDVSIIHYVDLWAYPDYDPNDIYNAVCIEVDDNQSASNNQFPYSEWNIIKNHTAIIFTDNAEECVLNKPAFSQSNIKIYPNPVSDILYFDTTQEINKVILFDLLGRKIIEQNNVKNISVSNLQKGTYILKLSSDQGVKTKKVVVE